jgi:hypothetical protein
MLRVLRTASRARPLVRPIARERGHRLAILNNDQLFAWIHPSNDVVQVGFRVVKIYGRHGTSLSCQQSRQLSSTDSLYQESNSGHP